MNFVSERFSAMLELISEMTFLLYKSDISNLILTSHTYRRVCEPSLCHDMSRHTPWIKILPADSGRGCSCGDGGDKGDDGGMEGTADR